VHVEMVQFLLKLLLKQRIVAMRHDFHWLLVATKLVTAKLHSCYVKDSEFKILERSEWEKVGRSSWTFYFRLSNLETNNVKFCLKIRSMWLLKQLSLSILGRPQRRSLWRLNNLQWEMFRVR